MEKYYTPKLHLDLIKAILAVVTSLLEESKIQYAIDGGTLMGAERHKNIIPWDDDADLLIFYKDYNIKLPMILEKIRKLSISYEDKEYKLMVEVLDNMTKIYIPNLWATTEVGRVIATPTVDIFRWEMKKDIIQLESLKQRRQFPNCYYKKSEMFPLKKYQFGELQLYGANDPLGYLHRYYGIDCLKVAKIDIRNPNEDSILSKSSKQITFDISPCDL